MRGECKHRTRMVEEATARYLCKTERMLRQRDDEIERLRAEREVYRKAGASLYHLVSLNNGADLSYEDALLAVDDEAATIDEAAEAEKEKEVSDANVS